MRRGAGAGAKEGGGRTLSLTETLKAEAPFFCDPELLSDDVTLEGLAMSCQGSLAYIESQKEWKQKLPERLEGLKVGDVAVYSLEPGKASLRYSLTFLADLPPQAQSRAAAQGELLEISREEGSGTGFAGESSRVKVSCAIRSELELNEQGRITKQKDCCSNGFGVADTIARYEVLMARRLPGTPSWLRYFEVIRTTVIEEAAYFDEKKNEEELEKDSRGTIGRNLFLGIGIGATIYVVCKILLLAATH